MFRKEVDKRYREAMIAFLKKHFRYHNMNSWNGSTSYANCITLHHVDKPSDIDDDTWWEMLEIAEWQEKMSDLLEDFSRKHNGNGRQESTAEAAVMLFSIKAA